jgi:alkanesulfonate monooxygenase SsuD/methylene tetrahydromethanopterin reductase-like flavin-dependent oxidoreductase (luciferase family)
MKIGIGLPATTPGVQGKLILDWARQADTGPFSTLGLIDRLVYDNFEPLITLAAVAGVTERIRLATTVLLAPLRNGAFLAKQSASLDALSGGRLTLGLGIGGREDDYRIAEEPFKNRGKRFEEQLALMERIWSGQPLEGESEPIGPKSIQPGGPEVLLGGNSNAAVQRVRRWGNGFITGGGGAEMARPAFDAVRKAWQEAGRAGNPRLVGCSYFAFGPQASEQASAYIEHYYRFLGPIAAQIASGVPTTPEAVRDTIKAFADIGADELILWPCIAELEQVSRLAELIGG